MYSPSYSELMEKFNENNENGKITSRYTIVIAAAKRARQLIDGAEPVTYAKIDKPVSVAVNEMNENKIRIIETGEQEEYYKAVRDQMIKEVDSLNDAF